MKTLIMMKLNSLNRVLDFLPLRSWLSFHVDLELNSTLRHLSQERKLTCKFSLFWPTEVILPGSGLRKRHQAAFCFGIEKTSVLNTVLWRYTVKSQPVPWLLYSKTPFLKNGENSQMACLDRWKPLSASTLRGEQDDDSITRNKFLR